MEAGAIVEIIDIQADQNEKASELRLEYKKNNLLFSKIDITHGIQLKKYLKVLRILKKLIF